MSYQRTLFIPLFLLIITGFGLASCDGGPPDEVVYEVTLLPTLGGTSSAGNGINNRGWVAGGSNHPGNQISEAALWKGETLIPLGTLGGPNSYVLWPGVNDRGMVVGVTEIEETNPPNNKFSCWVFFPSDTGHVCRGFFWEDGEMIAMPTLGETGMNSFAITANEQGQVVGWAETDVDDPTCNNDFQTKQFRAVIWEPRLDRITELPPLPGDSVGTANAINNRGQAAGISGDCGIAVGGPSAKHMVFYENGVPMEMEHLGGLNWHTPMAMNERGVVIGFSNPLEVTDGNLRPHAFRWTGRDGIRDLGVLPGDSTSQALGINERGQIVGLSRERDSDGNILSSQAFLWQDGTMHDLNDLVSEDFAGHLFFANDINDQGVITGGAIHPETGDEVAFRATPRRRGR